MVGVSNGAVLRRGGSADNTRGRVQLITMISLFFATED